MTGTNNVNTQAQTSVLRELCIYKLHFQRNLQFTSAQMNETLPFRRSLAASVCTMRVFYFESPFWTRRTLLRFHLIVRKNTASQNDEKAVIHIFCQILGAVQIKNCLVKWAALSDWGLHNWWWQVLSRTCQSSNGAKVTRWLVMDLAVWIYSYSPTVLTTRWTAAYSPIISCTFRLGSYMTFRKTLCHGADRIFWRCKLRFWHVISETGKKMLWRSEMVLNRKVLIYILCVHSEIKNNINSGFVRGKLEIPSASFKTHTDEFEQMRAEYTFI